MRMNAFRGFVVLVIAMSIVACGDDPEDITGEGDAIVSMPGFSFVPFTTEIARGESVTFDFPAQNHNVIFDRVTGAPPDILETSNRTVTRTFNVAGDFPYDCTLHPGMSGVVLVR
jgi:plastocyanin